LIRVSARFVLFSVIVNVTLPASLNEKLLDVFPNMYLAGASYYGVGIGACIGNGKKTAEKIIEVLNNHFE